MPPNCIFRADRFSLNELIDIVLPIAPAARIGRKTFSALRSTPSFGGIDASSNDECARVDYEPVMQTRCFA